jgi:type II restriction enzyme
MTREGIIARVERLKTALGELTGKQLDFIENIITQFRRPFLVLNRNKDFDLVDEQVLHDFGDVLRIHHCLSVEALSKDRFEYALERTLKLCGKSAELAKSKTNHGHDITINGVPFSLKTQADKGIKENEIHISKFMELGKGHWKDSVEDLAGLREQFLKHMTAYERIITLRCLIKGEKHFKYELVEIPKGLLQEAKDGKLTISKNSKQDPKPGHCTVTDEHGKVKFQLYFDGGSERKLQINHLRKELCTILAQWEFVRE